MKWTVIAGLALTLSLASAPAVLAADAAAPAAAKRYFATEADAAKGCGTEVVVWINKITGVYHLKESRWYGKTKDGAYACKNEMDLAGNHGAKTEK